MKTLSEIPEKIKVRLYPVVLSQFSQNDFHEVNIRSISSESGLSSATIYKYFKTKEGLLFRIINEQISELGNLIRTHISGLKSTSEIFRKVFWVTMDFFDRNPELAITAFITVPLKNFMKSGSYTRKTEIDILNEIVGRARKDKTIDSEIKKHQIADLYFMISQRHIHNWYYYGMKWKLADTIEEFFNYFWKTVKPEQKREDNNEQDN